MGMWYPTEIPLWGMGVFVNGFIKAVWDGKIVGIFG